MKLLHYDNGFHGFHYGDRIPLLYTKGILLHGVNRIPL